MACTGSIVENNQECNARGGVIAMAILPVSNAADIIFDPATRLISDVIVEAGEEWYVIQGDPTLGTLTWESTVNDDNTTTFTITGTHTFNQFSNDVYNQVAQYFDCCNSFIVIVQTTNGQLVIGPEPYDYLGELRPIRRGVQLSSSGDFGTLDGENSKTTTLTFTLETNYMPRIGAGLASVDIDALIQAA